jgi:hypothetical protein
VLSKLKIGPPKQVPRLHILELSAIFLIALILQAPFLDKAFHIDDTVVLEVSKRILEDPLDPLAGTFDWNGSIRPLWKVTTNPPLLSYYLAPVLFFCGFSEVAMHLAMVPFLFLLLVSCLVLAKRFDADPWLTMLIVGGSSAVLVSMNIMRDVPALAIANGGFALAIIGADSRPCRRGCLAVGVILIGLGVTTKYSAVVYLIVLIIYLLWSGRREFVKWVVLGCSPLAIWCLLTWLQYGEAHPIFLLTREFTKTSGPGVLSKYFSMLVALSSVCLVLPFLLARTWHHPRKWQIANGVFGLAMLALAYYDQEHLALQFYFWLVVGSLSLGALMLGALLPEGKFGWDPVDIFLFLWAGGFLCFSLFVVPFQAVRHILPALVPIAILCFRKARTQPGHRGPFRWPWVVVIVQLLLTMLVGWADLQYANVYRDFTTYVKERYDGEEIWYVGHWGWKAYADFSGFHQLHREGDDPPPGSILIWPRRVHIGSPFQERPHFKDSLELIENREVGSWLPIRTMSTPDAFFYALIDQNIPFAFSKSTLETFEVYRVSDLNNSVEIP